MKHKGYWAIGVLVMLLTFITKADAGYRRIDYNTADTINPASIAVATDADVTEVEPGRIPVEAVENAIPDTLNETEEYDENDEKVLTLLTFNIHSANNIEGSVQLEQIIEEIRETGAHIIGLQEVERLMPRSGYQDQARIIAEELGYYYYYGGNINILGVQYGNAFLSKYPILEVSNHKLPREMLEPRGLIEATVDVDGTMYHIYVTHLGLDSEERRNQIKYINDLIAQKEGNILLLGDFNNNPDSSEMAILDPRMTDSAAAMEQDNEYTYSNWDELLKVRIDRIYYSDNINLISHMVMPSQVSDHKRVITQISGEIIPSEGIYEVLSNSDNENVD